MRGGHNIKSKSELEKSGTFRKDRHTNPVLGAVETLKTIPDPPGEYDDRHREKWIEVCQNLKDIKQLTEYDIDLVAIYVQSWWIYFDAWKTICKEGSTITNARGQVRHPAVSIMNDANKLLIQIGSLLGFNPRARMSLRIEDVQPDKPDPLAELFGSGKQN